ncbi:MAG: hypothetical protein AAF483_25315, partial [Planctomycetota bacterium]
AMAVGAALTALARYLALRWNFVDRPEARKLHREPVPLLGDDGSFEQSCGTRAWSTRAAYDPTTTLK